MPKSQAVESQDEAQNVSQDESQAQHESQEESQADAQDESQIEEEEVENLAEGSLMTAQADINTTTTELKKVEKQRYVPPEEQCRQAAERENEEDTRRLWLSNFPPLSKSSERNRMLNKQRNKERVTSPGSAVGNAKTKAAKAGGSPNKWKR